MIPRITLGSVSPTELQKTFCVPGQPVILQGVLGHTRYTLQEIQEQLTGSETWANYCNNYASLPADERPNVRSTAMPIEEYIELLENGVAQRKDIYMGFVDISEAVRNKSATFGQSLTERLDAVGAALGLEKFPTGSTLYKSREISLWLGPGGHAEPLHFDLADGTLLQVVGRKHIVFFPPELTRSLYPDHFLSGANPTVSRMALDSADLASFPRFQHALRYRQELTLEPGEALYIPTNWWHKVTSLGDGYTCSVSRFWQVRPLRRCFLSREAAAMFFLEKMPRTRVIRFRAKARNLMQAARRLASHGKARAKGSERSPST